MRIFLAIAALFTFVAMAPPVKKVTIQTNAVCEMCERNIESALRAVEGVKDADLDLVTKKVKIKYDEDVVDLATLRQAISAAGYEADEVPARPKARENLANCCKRGDEAKAKSCSKTCEKPCGPKS